MAAIELVVRPTTDELFRWAGDEERRLLEGLARPTPPPALAPGQEVYVAVWRRGDHGALLSIVDDPEDEEEPHALEVTAFLRTGGRWRRLAAGGSDWPVEYGRRPAIDHPALTGFGLGLADSLELRSGMAPAGVEAACVEIHGATVRASVDEVTGAFLVAVPYHVVALRIRAC